MYGHPSVFSDTVHLHSDCDFIYFSYKSTKNKLGSILLYPNDLCKGMVVEIGLYYVVLAGLELLNPQFQQPKC